MTNRNLTRPLIQCYLLLSISTVMTLASTRIHSAAVLLSVMLAFVTTGRLLVRPHARLAFLAPLSISVPAGSSFSSGSSAGSASNVCRATTSSTSIPTMQQAAYTKAAPSSASITGPKWDLEYSSLDAPELLADIAGAMASIDKISKLSGPLREAVPEAASLIMETPKGQIVVETLVEVFDLYWEAKVLLGNARVYVSCVKSVDGSNEKAKKLAGNLAELSARLSAAYEPANLLLALCSDAVADAFVASTDATRAVAFNVRHARKIKDHKLTLAEENTVTSLSVTGHTAWGQLYTEISTSIKAHVLQADGTRKTVGVATAAGLLDSPEESVRRNAWEAIREAWLPHANTCAAALNSITGWRHTVNEKRAHDTFLAPALHDNRMEMKSLKAMFEAIDSRVEVGRKALALQAKALGKSRVDLWDFFAPSPIQANGDAKLYTFDEGIELIANAVTAVDKEAGDFVRMMRDNKWIEASRGDSKVPGAYCTGFYKSRTPRVYLSEYNGRSAMLLTLAHELGHAYHSWIMRDMPLTQTNYPMNLAETASIFFETVVGNELVRNAASPSEKFAMLWGEAESGATFLLNIPSRFRFEEELNVRRKEGSLSAKEMDDVMVESWKRYYGDSVNGLERVGVFSQSKLHFYLTGLSFYNFPYR